MRQVSSTNRRSIARLNNNDNHWSWHICLNCNQAKQRHLANDESSVFAASFFAQVSGKVNLIYGIEIIDSNWLLSLLLLPLF